jgi:tetratricopeptide (TPR) repeat protein
MVSFAREWRETMGNAAATDLAALGCRTELLEIAKDKRLDQGIRYQAARDLLKKAGPDEPAIDALYQQALEQLTTVSVTTRIVDALGESGASDTLLKLIRLDSMDLAVRIHVAEVLDEYAMLDALWFVKNDREMDAAVRERAFWGLIGKTSGSESVSLVDELISTLEREPANGERLVGVLAGAKNWDGLIRVLEHSKAQDAVREIAISRLISEKRIEELRYVVESVDLPLLLRQMAAEGLREKGSPEEEKERLLRFYSQYLEYSPGNARVLRERAQLFLSVGEYRNATKDFGLLIEQDGNDEVSLGCRGNALRLSRSYADAIADFDRALAIDPDDAWDLMRRGLSKWELGHWGGASSDFLRAFELGSVENKYYAHYADCLCELEKYEDAFAIACKAVNLDFMTAMPYAVRGSIYSATGRWEEAALDFSQALLLSSEYKWALRQRATAYRCSQKFALCIDDLNHLLNVSEDDRSARFQRCEVSLRMGDYVTAAQDLALLSYNRERNGWLLYLHWLAQRVRGRNKESNSDLRELREDLESRWAKDELGEYEQSNLAIYHVAEGQSERAREIYNRMICQGKHRFLAQTALPELIDLVTIVPSVADIRELYDEISQQIVVVQQKYELKGGVEMPNGRLNPMYCRKAYISGLWDEKERADRLLARHADRRRTIVIWRLEDDWVYGQCNFKHSPEDEYTFKFVDHLETVLKRDLEMFIAANLQRILFLENELRQAFEVNVDMGLDSYLLNYDLIEDEEASKTDGIP